MPLSSPGALGFNLLLHGRAQACVCLLDPCVEQPPPGRLMQDGAGVRFPGGEPGHAREVHLHAGQAAAA